MRYKRIAPGGSLRAGLMHNNNVNNHHHHHHNNNNSNSNNNNNINSNDNDDIIWLTYVGGGGEGRSQRGWLNWLHRHSGVSNLCYLPKQSQALAATLCAF